MTETHKMTATEAQTFETFSLANALALTTAAEEHGCTCQPYVDWFTYKRWTAQGFQVQKGEHGVKLTTYIPVTKETEDGKTEVTHTRPWHTSVFCRCQVKAIEKAS